MNLFLRGSAMLFYKDLENIVFTRNELFVCDELVVISGYVGPSPIHKVKDLPLKTTVVYGMYGCDGIQQSLHNALLEENKAIDNLSVLYSSMPVHAKCYIWKNKGEVVHALIGSANFSINGLTTPYKEVLAETTKDTFIPLLDYSQKVIDNSIFCEDAIVKSNKKKLAEKVDYTFYDPDVCSVPLYIEEHGVKKVQDFHGINWGMAKLNGSHVNINDACIKIGMELIKHYPQLFPAKQKAPVNIESVVRQDHRHNDNIEIIWDDGTTMTGLLEGSVPKIEDGEKVLYPKQLSTSPRKSELGKYIRKRLGVKEGVPITMEDLEAYGRTSIDVSLQGEGIYYFDFSPKKKEIV